MTKIEKISQLIYTQDIYFKSIYFKSISLKKFKNKQMFIFPFKIKDNDICGYKIDDNLNPLISSEHRYITTTIKVEEVDKICYKQVCCKLKKL